MAGEAKERAQKKASESFIKKSDKHITDFKTDKNERQSQQAHLDGKSAMNAEEETDEAEMNAAETKKQEEKNTDTVNGRTKTQRRR